MRYQIWNNKEETQYKKAYEQLDDFFETLYHHSDDTISTDSIKSLIYREGQNSYALDIMESIKNKSIQLIQAGVGIGKSFGYILPIFYTYNNVEKFNKIIISTSSIALQEQLQKDVETISKMLNIKINTEIVKGINNYACLKRIEYHLSSIFTSEENKEILTKIRSEIERVESSDRADLSTVSERVWETIQIKSRGYCSNCTYSKICPFYKKEKSIKDANIIITNHANMVRNTLDDKDFIKYADMIVFDEAHKLEENMRNIQIGEMRLDKIQKSLDKIEALMTNRYSQNTICNIEEDNDLSEFFLTLINDFGTLFSNIRASASKNFFNLKEKMQNEEDYSITDSDFIAFRITPKVQSSITKLLKKISFLFKQISIYELKSGHRIQTKEVKYLYHILNQLMDMSKKEESDYIYWTSFYQKNKINICYTPKDNSKITKNIFSSEIPIIFTSGTLLDNQNSYKYFSEGIGLNQLTNRTIVYGDAQASPYDYENNSLFYYNPDIASPKDHDNYIKDLALEISELIKATEGKALILFTSKKCMNEVYELVSKEEYQFDILLQTDTNTTEIKEKFSQDINSCLFATGAFWEGIDVKGKSLSNLIITHLPFDQVNAINQYKASKYSTKEQFRQVYFPNMLMKLEQAVGRLIRSSEDTGIVCCLDSRFSVYKNAISRNLPMKNYTTDKKDIYVFVDEKILENKTDKKLCQIP